MRELTPQQRDRVLQNSKAFQNLAPEQQGRIRQQFNRGPLEWATAGRSARERRYLAQDDA